MSNIWGPFVWGVVGKDPLSGGADQSEKTGFIWRECWCGALSQRQGRCAHDSGMVQASPIRTQALQRRSISRERCLLACRIVFGPNAFTLDAVVRDVSDTGARIRLPTLLPLPKFFQVIFRDGDCQEAETIWQRGQELGVRFLGPIDLQDPTDASVRLLRRLWADMAARNCA